MPLLDLTSAATARALDLSFTVLIPALAPFFFLTELLLALGVAHGFATLANPLMRPLFRLPGSAALVVVLGFLSGYPVAAKLAAAMVREQLLSEEEAERVVCFATTADPLFLAGAVVTGFLALPALIPLAALAHYGSALALGFALRYRVAPAVARNKHTPYSQSLLRAATEAMRRARSPLPIRTLMSTALHHTARLLVLICGLVIVFAVLVDLLALVPSEHLHALSSIFLEVSIGAQFVSTMPMSSMMQLALASFVVAWGGLSVHVQIASIISNMRFRYGIFILCRMIHGLLAASIVYIAATVGV